MNKLLDLAVAPIRRALRQEVGRLIENDAQIRWAITRCARSVTKDFLAELSEAVTTRADPGPVDVPPDHFEQSRLDLPSPLTPDQRAAADEYLERKPS